ncbi:unnamed protein product [Brassica oleracea var. botrytis]
MTSSSSIPAPPKALTPPTLMAEDDGYAYAYTSTQLLRVQTDHNYAYTSTHYPVTTTATSVQLVTGNCSYLLQLLTGSCSLNSTEHISRSRKDKDSGNIFDDENKLTYAIPFKDNVYGFGDDGLRSITANCRGFCQFR